jgi:uncharacterized membrane protein
MPFCRCFVASIGLTIISLAILVFHRSADAATTYSVSQFNALTGVVNCYGSSGNRNTLAGVIFASPSHAYVRTNGVETAIGSDGFTISWGFDANDSGQAVGFLTNTFPGYKVGDKGFLYSAGTVTPLPVLSGTGYTQATSINNAGTIVGISIFKPYMTTIGAATLTQLPDPGTDGTGGANNINTAGEIVGWAGVAGVRVPARWSGGGSSGALLPMPAGATQAEATLINDAGVIAGQATFPTPGRHAFFYDAGGFAIDMGTIAGFNQSEVFDINASRQAVGICHNVPVGPPAPFFYANGTMVDLNTLLPANSGWNLLSALTINDLGEITGTGFFHGVSSGYKLTPVSVPEPLGGLALLMGASIHALRRRRFSLAKRATLR